MSTQTIWVEPEVFVNHGGLKVFYTYKNDDIEQGPNRFWFTLNWQCGVEAGRCGDEPCRHVFDVRELSCWQPSAPPPCSTGEINTLEDQGTWELYWKQDEKAIRIAITTAIDRGEISQPSGEADQSL